MQMVSSDIHHKCTDVVELPESSPVRGLSLWNRTYLCIFTYVLCMLNPLAVLVLVLQSSSYFNFPESQDRKAKTETDYFTGRK